MQHNLVFFGNERLASGCTTQLPILNNLLDSGHNIKLIVISEKGTKSRSKRDLEVEEFANKHKIDLLIPENNEQLKTKLKEVNAELAILAAYGKIISQEIIELFPKGIINLHPSLLPKYRGPTPIESAILNGDSQTGVSIMSLTAGMDSGPVYSQIELRLNGNESKQSLADQIGGLGAKEINRLLSLATLPSPTEQTGEPTICSLIKKTDSILDSSKPAKQLEREVRAYWGWPGSKTTLKLKDGSDLDITVTEAEVVKENDESPLTLKTSKDYFRITKLKIPGKQEMSTKDFLNGYRSKVV